MLRGKNFRLRDVTHFCLINSSEIDCNWLLINNNYNIAILDDGFQDLSIKPDFSILCFNSKQMIGNGFVIPSGPLRERLNSIIRADCIIINGQKDFEFEKKISEYEKTNNKYWRIGSNVLYN